MTRDTRAPRSFNGASNLPKERAAMNDPASAAFDTRSLAALAQQLRDGPLQELMELHRKTALVAAEAAVDEHVRLQQLTELALVSLSAMEQFHAFTCELRAQIAALAATPARDLH
jgi:hypothetical protein